MPLPGFTADRVPGAGEGTYRAAFLPWAAGGCRPTIADRSGGRRGRKLLLR